MTKKKEEYLILEVPTFAGVQLGPLTRHVRGVDGECGCLRHWEAEIRTALHDLEGWEAMKQFSEALEDALHERIAETDKDSIDITSFYAENTNSNRRIAYLALRDAWQALGYK